MLWRSWLTIWLLHEPCALGNNWIEFYLFFLAFHGLSRLEVKKEKEDSFSVFTALRQLGQESELRIARMLLTHQNKHKFIVFEDDIEYTLLHMWYLRW